MIWSVEIIPPVTLYSDTGSQDEAATVYLHPLGCKKKADMVDFDRWMQGNVTYCLKIYSTCLFLWRVVNWSVAYVIAHQTETGKFGCVTLLVMARHDKPDRKIDIGRYWEQISRVERPFRGMLIRSYPNQRIDSDTHAVYWIRVLSEAQELFSMRSCRTHRL